MNIKSIVSTLADGARSFRARAVARWSTPFAKVSVCAGGLVLLAFIGRPSFAGNAVSFTASSAFPPANDGVAPEVADAAAAAADAPATKHTGPATIEDPVYLNEATIEDLRRLPGIGTKRADAIVTARAKVGHFHHVEDLLKVKGIGRGMLKKLRPLVRVDRPVPVPPRDAGVD